MAQKLNQRWSKMEGNSINGNMPTEKQLDTIRRLAKRTRSSVDLNKITTKQEASKFIEELISKQNGSNASNGNSNYDFRERKVVYGLAVKLVYARYQQSSMDTKTDAFWKDVDEFYKQYLEHQDRVTNSVFKR
jgi:hypothetical protein